MIIVVEGPDGAGKSTLIDNLRLSCEQHYVTLRRSGPPKIVDEINRIIWWIEKHSGPTPLILDRHPFISEAIYGEVLRGNSLLTSYYTIGDLQNHFRVYVDRLIYCRPPSDQIFKSMKANPQLTGVTSNIERIIERYDQTMKLLVDWGVRVIEYDWTTHVPEELPIDRMFFGDLT